MNIDKNDCKASNGHAFAHACSSAQINWIFIRSKKNLHILFRIYLPWGLLPSFRVCANPTADGRNHITSFCYCYFKQWIQEHRMQAVNQLAAWLIVCHKKRTNPSSTGVCFSAESNRTCTIHLIATCDAIANTIRATEINSVIWIYFYARNTESV